MTELNNKQTTETETREQIVTFKDDGMVSRNVKPLPKAPLCFLETGEDTIIHSVKDILERPVEVSNFTWTLANAAGTEIDAAITLPQSWYGIPMIREKLSGFMYLRCNFIVRVQVNAQPFHAGRLLVVHEPLRTQQSYVPSNLLHFGGATGYNHVDLDLGQATSAEIRIPFLQNITHFDLVRAIGNLGSVRFFVYSKLTGTTDVEGTVWVQAEDVRIHMPTGLGLWPRVVAEAQSNESGDGGSATLDPGAAVQAEQKAKGIVETTARVVSGVANALTGVPIVSSMATGIAWVADAVAGVASIFGWSKPIDESPNHPMVPQFAKDMMNFNGDCKAKVLAFDRRNANTVPADVFGTKADEMAISYIISKPVFVDRFSITTANVPNQVVWSFPVSPSACMKTTLSNVRYKLNTRMSYLAELFQLWRGTIRYHFKFVKTVYHSARLRITFVPGSFEDTPVAGIDINKVYSQIIDMRQINEYDFEVPFIYNQPWMSLKEMDSLKGKVSETLPTGMIYIEMLNALRAPSTAADFVEVLVETSAGADFQYAYPKTTGTYAPHPKITVATFLTKSNVPTAVQVHSLGKAKKMLAAAGNKTHPQYKVVKKEKGARKEVETQKKNDVQEVTVPPEEGVRGPRPQQPPTPTVLAPKARLSNEEICALPMSTGPDIPVLLPDGHPTKQYDVYTQTSMWNTWKRSNPNADSAKAWDQFVYLYPVAACPLRRKVRETGEVQSQLVQQHTEQSLCSNTFGMGEVVTSLRQMLKRYQFVVGADATEAQSLRLFPLVTSAARAGATDFVAADHNTVFDRVSLMYRWVSGSMRVGITSKDGSDPSDKPHLVMSQPGWAGVAYTPQNSAVDWPGTINALQNEAYALAYPATEKFMEFSLPMYQRGPAVPTQVGGIVPADLDLGSFGLDFVPSNYGTSINIDGPCSLSLWKSLGEDFAFGYLIGPPLTGTPLV